MLQEDDRPLELESEPTSLLRPRKLLLLSPSCSILLYGMRYTKLLIIDTNHTAQRQE